MREKRANQIGIDRILQLPWLEKTAILVKEGEDAATITGVLEMGMQDSFRGAKTTARGAIAKTITNLLKIWLRPPAHMKEFQKQGLQLFEECSESEHIILHWGMTMAVYPFWFNVAIQTGRLLRLQSSLTIMQVQRRICEQYGERQTVSRAGQRVVRSFVHWGVLKDGSQKGFYAIGDTINIDDPRLLAWMMEALLYSRNVRSAPLRELRSTPGLFPFQFAPISGERLVSASSRLDFVCQGVDEVIIMLRDDGTAVS